MISHEMKKYSKNVLPFATRNTIEDYMCKYIMYNNTNFGGDVLIGGVVTYPAFWLFRCGSSISKELFLAMHGSLRGDLKLVTDLPCCLPEPRTIADFAGHLPWSWLVQLLPFRAPRFAIVLCKKVIHPSNNCNSLHKALSEMTQLHSTFFATSLLILYVVKRNAN
jgi:hypothetical protein